MINKEKIYNIIELRKFYEERCWDQPNEDEDFWISITDELSQSIDETIDFLKELGNNDFTIVLETFEELVQQTQSERLIDAAGRIGKEKHIDEKYLEKELEFARKCIR